MKAATNTTLQTYLAQNRQLLKADLFTLTLASGAQSAYTSADRDLTYLGTTYTSSDVRMQVVRRKEGVGLVAASCEVLASPLPTSLLNGQSWWAALQLGTFDYARLRIQRLFMPTWGDPSLGAFTWFEGRVSDIDAGRTALRFTIKSDIELLNVQMPRNLYQAGCLHTLYDTGCLLSQAAWTVTGTVALGGSTSSVISTSSLTQPTGFFDLGWITFLSGALTGLQATVKSYVSGTPSTITVLAPFPSAPAAGDSFSIVAGCDKQQSTCTSKFNNLVHFRGLPYVPVPETAT